MDTDQLKSSGKPKLVLALSAMSLLAVICAGVLGLITISDLKSDNDVLRERLADQEQVIESVAAELSATRSDVEAQQIEIDDLGVSLSNVESTAREVVARVECLVATLEWADTSAC